MNSKGYTLIEFLISVPLVLAIFYILIKYLWDHVGWIVNTFLFGAITIWAWPWWGIVLFSIPIFGSFIFLLVMDLDFEYFPISLQYTCVCAAILASTYAIGFYSYPA